MLALHKAPKRADAIKRLKEAEEYFANQWMLGAQFVNKSLVNKRFGRNQANTAIAKFFTVLRRGTNLSGKITEIAPKALSDLPDDRQLYLTSIAHNDDLIDLGDPPTEFDMISTICVQIENKEAAIQWCKDTGKMHLVKQVKTLLSKRFWTVYYKEKTDRFYAMWPFCLTNWPSELRKIILNGTDYDLNNAIGQFMLQCLGDNISKYPDAFQYLTNPKNTRHELVSILQVDQDQAKKVLHATVNGCATSKNSILSGKSALNGIVTVDQAIKYTNAFSSLIKQLKLIRKEIAPSTKEFMRAYFAWEKKKTQEIFKGTGLIMHDGLDGCAIGNVINHENIKISESRGAWSNGTGEPLIAFGE